MISKQTWFLGASFCVLMFGFGCFHNNLVLLSKIVVLSSDNSLHHYVRSIRTLSQRHYVGSVRTLSQCLTCLLNGTLEAYRCPFLALLTHEPSAIVQNGLHYGLADENPMFLVDTLIIGLVVFDDLAIDDVAWMLVDLSPPPTQDVSVFWLVLAVLVVFLLFLLLFLI